MDVSPARPTLPDNDISLTVSARGSVATLEIRGEWDLADEPEFGARTREALASDCDHLVVDLRHAEFIDSTGLKQLLELEARSRQDGFRLWVVASSHETVRRVLRTTGVDRMLPLVDRPPDLPG